MIYFFTNGTSVVQILEKGESWEFFFLYLLLKFYNFDSFFFAYFYDIIPLIPPQSPNFKNKKPYKFRIYNESKGTNKSKRYDYIIFGGRTLKLEDIKKIKETKHPGIFNCIRYEYSNYEILVYKTNEDVTVTIHDKQDNMGVLIPRGNIIKILNKPDFVDSYSYIDLTFINSVHGDDVNEFISQISEINQLLRYKDFYFNEIEKLGEV